MFIGLLLLPRLTFAECIAMPLRPIVDQAAVVFSGTEVKGSPTKHRCDTLGTQREQRDNSAATPTTNVAGRMH